MRPALLEYLTDSNRGFDEAGLVLQVPVAPQESAAGGVVAGADVGPGQLRQVLHESPADCVLRNVAAIDQQVRIGSERGAPARDRLAIVREPRRIQRAAAQFDPAVRPVRDQMHRADVVTPGQHLADLRDTVAVRIEQEDFHLARAVVLAQEVIDQHLMVGHALVDEDDLVGALLRWRGGDRRRGGRRGHRLEQPHLGMRRPVAGVEQAGVGVRRVQDARLELLDDGALG